MTSHPRSRRPGMRLGPAVLVLTFLACCAALAACTDILGIVDREMTTGSGANGGGGTGGTGAMGGTGGTAGSGTAGSGGSDGTCMTDADCVGSPYGEKCDTAAHKCVECLPGPDDTCAFGLYCDVTKV